MLTLTIQSHSLLHRLRQQVEHIPDRHDTTETGLLRPSLSLSRMLFRAPHVSPSRCWDRRDCFFCPVSDPSLSSRSRAGGEKQAMQCRNVGPRVWTYQPIQLGRSKTSVPHLFCNYILSSQRELAYCSQPPPIDPSLACTSSGCRQGLTRIGCAAAAGRAFTV